MLGLYYCALPCLVMPCIVMLMPCSCYAHAMLCHTLAVSIPAVLMPVTVPPSHSTTVPPYHPSYLLALTVKTYSKSLVLQGTVSVLYLDLCRRILI